MRLRTLTALAAASLLIGPGMALAEQSQGIAGAVYTMTNDPEGNEVLVFDRLADGSLLVPPTTYSTGGNGSGSGLGSQGGVVLSEDGRWLLVVNAGSHDVSLFSVHRHGLTWVDTEPSGGLQPVSVAIHQDLVYVVNAESNSIAGLRLGRHGMLSAVPGSSESLSGAGTAPAQIGFSPDGRFLVVTEKATHLIDVFPMDRNGSAGERVENQSSGNTPFAFDFGNRGQLFVSEVAGGVPPSPGAVSSYHLEPNGSLTVIDGSVPNHQLAPCWLVVTRGGRYAFTTNTPDDSLSAYAIDFEGGLQLLDGRAGEPGLGRSPLDMDLSDDGRFLYTLNIGNDTISTFRVMPDGSLRLLGETGVVLPLGVNGLAAR